MYKYLCLCFRISIYVFPTRVTLATLPVTLSLLRFMAEWTKRETLGQRPMSRCFVDTIFFWRHLACFSLFLSQPLGLLLRSGGGVDVLTFAVWRRYEIIN